jgi:hypothetical protein
MPVERRNADEKLLGEEKPSANAICFGTDDRNARKSTEHSFIITVMNVLRAIPYLVRERHPASNITAICRLWPAAIQFADPAGFP